MPNFLKNWKASVFIGPWEFTTIWTNSSWTIIIVVIITINAWLIVRGTKDRSAVMPYFRLQCWWTVSCETGRCSLELEAQQREKREREAWERDMRELEFMEKMKHEMELKLPGE